MNRRSMMFFGPRSVLLAGLACTVFVAVFVRAQEEEEEAKIKSAMAGGPPEIAKNARIVEFGERGNLTTLREGSNGWTCFPGHPGMTGAMCLDEPALHWLTDLIAHKPKPTNTRPGILYMLKGGMRRSATDPWATDGTPVKEPPHWALIWPFNPKEAGLSDKPKDTGAWVMYAGTPYAHLMINQQP
jgi:hypothetical protein